MRKLLLLTATITLLVALAGCGASSRTTAPQPTAPAPSTRPAAKPVQQPTRAVAAVRVIDTAYGQALADHRGFALYRFTHDVSTASTCYGACASAWPPYVVTVRPSTVGVGARATLLGAVRRRDGRLQVTYAGRPLYYYVRDRSPREVLCQAVTEFGGTWNVVAADGHTIR